MSKRSPLHRKRALLSVSDKRGIADFAVALEKNGYEILSTGGTAAELEHAGVSVTAIEKVTHFPESFGGRVKTMHPFIMGAILFKRDDPKQVEEAKILGIEPIDIVVVNLYPFEKTHAIEQIDIGGPTLLRSAAKNYEGVTVICDPADYKTVLAELKREGSTSPETRQKLAAKVFLHTAAYDALIAKELSGSEHGGVLLTGGRELRYGENPHQWGRFYETLARDASRDIRWKQLQGKELSYLNILDADAAWRMVCEFSEPTAVFVKHANPSGIASHKDIAKAFQLAYDTDRVSAFGVIIAINRTCTAAVAKKIIDQKIFTEILLAPVFDKGAIDLLKQKPNLRVITMGSSRDSSRGEDIIYRSAFGGMLVQNEDLGDVTAKSLKCVTKKKPTKKQIDDLLFAWKVVKHAKSNAIVFVKDKITVGIGCGQTSRVDATWIAAKRAGKRAKGAVMASDAFFPFPDALNEAVKHGISAVIQPGGSIRDTEVFAAADKLKIAMVLTGMRAFRH